MRLLGELDELEMRRATGSGPRIDPVTDDFRVCKNLVAEPEERNIGKLFLQVVADRLQQLRAMRGVRRFLYFRESFREELVLVVVVISRGDVEVAHTLV